MSKGIEESNVCPKCGTAIDNKTTRMINKDGMSVIVMTCGCGSLKLEVPYKDKDSRIYLTD